MRLKRPTDQSISIALMLSLALLPLAARAQHSDSLVFSSQLPPPGPMFQLEIGTHATRGALHVVIAYNDRCDDGPPYGSAVRMADTLIVFLDISIFGDPARLCPAIYRPVAFGATIAGLKPRRYVVRMRVIRSDQPFGDVYRARTDTVRVR